MIGLPPSEVKPRIGFRMIVMSPLLSLALLLATQPGGPAPASRGTSIMVAGQPVDVGRTVVLWSDEQGFNGYDKRCIAQSGGCCDADWLRYGVTARRKRNVRRLGALQAMREEKRTAKRSPGQVKLEAAEGAQRAGAQPVQRTV